MRKLMQLIIINAIFWLGLSPVFSQELIISDGTARYRNRDYPAVVVRMEPGVKEVREAWRDFLRKRYRVRLRGGGFLSNRDVLRAENANFRELANTEVDFYTEIVEESDLTKMSVFASLGDDYNIGLGNDFNQYYNMKGIVQSFLDTYLRGYYENEVKDAQKQVSDLEKSESDKRNRITNNDKEIARLQAENVRLTEEIATTQTNSVAAREELEKRRIRLENILRQLAEANNPVFYNTKNKE
jgi:hypothetical protein